LSIGYANICSSVQDHRNFFISLKGSERTKESKRINKKEAWSVWINSVPEVQSAPEVMTSSETSSSEAPHQKLKFIRSWRTQSWNLFLSCLRVAKDVKRCNTDLEMIFESLGCLLLQERWKRTIVRTVQPPSPLLWSCFATRQG